MVVVLCALFEATRSRPPSLKRESLLKLSSVGCARRASLEENSCELNNASMARLTGLVLSKGVALLSSDEITFAVTFDPRQNFVLAEPPVLPKSVARQSLPGPFAHVSVDPGRAHLQQCSYLLDREQTVVLPALVACGRICCGIIESRAARFHVLLFVSKREPPPSCG